MQYLLQARRQNGGELPHIRLVMVGMRQNLHEIPDIVRLAHRLEIGSIFVQHLAHDFKESTLPAHYKPMRDFVEKQTLLNEDPDRIERFFAEARATALEFGIELRLPHTRVREHAPDTPGRDRCDWPWRGAYISYQGLAMPCCMVATPDRINFGNFGDQGVESLWAGDTYQKFRDALDSSEPPAVCKSCSIYSGTF
jgi:radical SAM protein with 4Fe4S-binding SPASM domain